MQKNIFQKDNFCILNNVRAPHTLTKPEIVKRAPTPIPFEIPFLFELVDDTGNVNLVEQELKQDDVDVNCRDDKNCTPLMRVIYNESQEVMAVLLAHEKLRINLKF